MYRNQLILFLSSAFWDPLPMRMSYIYGSPLRERPLSADYILGDTRCYVALTERERQLSKTVKHAAAMKQRQRE